MPFDSFYLFTFRIDPNYTLRTISLQRPWRQKASDLLGHAWDIAEKFPNLRKLVLLQWEPSLEEVMAAHWYQRVVKELPTGLELLHQQSDIYRSR